jgi:hypothetical protein
MILKFRIVKNIEEYNTTKQTRQDMTRQDTTRPDKTKSKRSKAHLGLLKTHNALLSPSKQLYPYPYKP